MTVEPVPDPPTYELQDRRFSGEWRPIATFRDPEAANQVAALLRFHGSDVRVEVIPAPHIP